MSDAPKPEPANQSRPAREARLAMKRRALAYLNDMRPLSAYKRLRRQELETEITTLEDSLDDQRRSDTQGSAQSRARLVAAK